MKLIAGSALLLSIASCYPPPRVPVQVLRFPASTTDSRCLLVLLPGRGDRGNSFPAHGFIGIVRELGISVDVEAADLHFGYYKNGTALDRLEKDVIAPAQPAGYDHIWLAGISAGGLASLAYAMDHPGEISGIILLSPYLGDEEIIKEIRNAGGVMDWNPGEISFTDFQRRLWAGVKNKVTKRGVPPVFLGYGANDRLADSHRLLSTVLPPERIFVVEGGHNWRTWKRLWKKILEEKGPEIDTCGR